jgi:citrate lyase beta subunit
MSALDNSFSAKADKHLAKVDEQLANKYRGDFGGRQPIHTCYIPADKLTATSQNEWSSLALDTLKSHAPDAKTLAKAVGIDAKVVEAIYEKVIAKIKREPIEDLRIDFEDGYGRRGDSEEEGHLQSALAAISSITTPFIGIRIKSMESVTRARSIKTLDQFITGLIAQGAYPKNFVITLPKVTFVEQVEVMVMAVEALEKVHKIPAGTIRFEIQIETTQSIFGPDGQATAAKMIDATKGRLAAFHYGTYDYSAAAGISAAYQTLDHPAADYAKQLLQVVAAGTTVRLSDGSTNILPVGSTEQVHAAMQNHYRLVRRALERGFYQGWDLHGSQLPTRVLANIVFYREGLQSAANRLRTYLERAESGTMDEPATALTLANYFLRGLDAGAIDSSEIKALTNQDEEALRGLVLRKGQIS